MSETSREMIVLPPHVTSFEGALSKEDLDGLFFFSNPVRQKNSRTRKNFAYVAVNDLLEKGALSDVNASARHFATQWCHEAGLEENLKFCGVNMGSLFFMEFTYFFIGALKAFHVSKALLEAWGPSHEMTLVDDGTYWSKVFKHTARLRDKSLRLVAVKPDLTVGDAETVNFRGIIRSIAKNILAIWNIPSAGNLKPGGILYSAAPRYIEPLWTYDQSAPGYYLRTEFSVKASKTIKKDFPHLVPILPSKPGDTAPRAALLQWMQKSRVLETVSAYFDSHPLFIYQGVDFWPMVKEDFLQKIKKRILQKGAWVYSVDRWIKTLKPKMIVVDEDVTPFNQALIERANLDRIPSIQIQHGIPEPDNHLIPIRSTHLLVPGEAAKKRMLEMGARSEQVEIVGAPHYEARFRDIPKKQYEEQVYRDLKLPHGTRIVTLITHNF
ncbi:MAG TPA: hypothetical protein VD913_06720, partial [bacterium]|nr:hypothetical protein [bacterium]